MDEQTKSTLKSIPLLTINAGPRDPEWEGRLKEELSALISYIKQNKQNGNHWFTLTSDKKGIQWTGKCWYVYNLLKYEFDFSFEIPMTYPVTAMDILIPELEGKTVKMFKGGKICQALHFHPLWSRNVPHFGVAHALALGVCYFPNFFLTNLKIQKKNLKNLKKF